MIRSYPRDGLGLHLVEHLIGEVAVPLLVAINILWGTIPWLVIGDLNDGIVTDSRTKITEDGLRNSAVKWIEEGSVLIAMYGSIGKLGIAGRRLTTNQAIAFTKPEPILPKYLFYYLLRERENLGKRGIGVTQKNISQTIIKGYPFLLAPLQEQRRIVSNNRGTLHPTGRRDCRAAPGQSATQALSAGGPQSRHGRRVHPCMAEGASRGKLSRLRSCWACPERTPGKVGSQAASPDAGKRERAKGR